MTKKFWNDWQKRIGETDLIYVFYNDDKKRGYPLYHNYKTKLNKIKFDGDYVTIEWDVEYLIFDNKSWGLVTKIEHFNKTLHRNQISTVRFKLQK